MWIKSKAAACDCGRDLYLLPYPNERAYSAVCLSCGFTGFLSERFEREHGGWALEAYVREQGEDIMREVRRAPWLLGWS